MNNTFYYQFHKQPVWVADMSVELYGIRLDAEDIYLTSQWYEHIPEIYVSDLFYRLYCDNPPQVQSHTHILHGKISINQIYGTAERQTSAIYKISHYHSQYMSMYYSGNEMEESIFSNKISKEVIFYI